MDQSPKVGSHPHRGRVMTGAEQPTRSTLPPGGYFGHRTPQPLAHSGADKNWLFAGSPAGGERAATLYSLVESCRMQGIDPLAYLRSVIGQVATHPMSRIAELTPRGWAEEVRAVVS